VVATIGFNKAGVLLTGAGSEGWVLSTAEQCGTALTCREKTYRVNTEQYLYRLHPTGETGKEKVKIDWITLPDYSYAYTGGYQIFVAPRDGEYEIELWGASGGPHTSNKYNGKGGYTKGKISLSVGDVLYLYLGGQGGTYDGKNGGAGGRNGGGAGGNSASGKQGARGGGGATDVRLVSGNWNDATGLKSRIMVA
jgi:hypothetical protein